VTGQYIHSLHAHPQSSFSHLEDYSPPTRNLPRYASSFPNPERIQPPDSADRSRQRPRDQLFILYVGVCIPYPAAHETTIYLLTPLADSIPGFCDLSAFQDILENADYALTCNCYQGDTMALIYQRTKSVKIR